MASTTPSASRSPGSVVLDVDVLGIALVDVDDEVVLDGGEVDDVVVGRVVLVDEDVVDVVGSVVVEVDDVVVGRVVVLVLVDDEVVDVVGLVVVLDVVVVPSPGTVARHDAAATRVLICALTTSPKSRSRFESPPASRWQ
jgi:hypothetical protein